MGLRFKHQLLSTGRTRLVMSSLPLGGDQRNVVEMEERHRGEALLGGEVTAVVAKSVLPDLIRCEVSSRSKDDDHKSPISRSAKVRILNRTKHFVLPPAPCRSQLTHPVPPPMQSTRSKSLLSRSGKNRQTPLPVSVPPFRQNLAQARRRGRDFADFRRQNRVTPRTFRLRVAQSFSAIAARSLNLCASIPH